MKNHEIPSEIWRLRNEIIREVENYMSNSNNAHMDYKRDFVWGARGIRSLCDDIEKLANQYVQDTER